MILPRCAHPRPCYDDGKCHYKGECGHKAPLTNADRIRAMSDEELAVVMYHLFCDTRTDKECKAFGDCNQCALEWLQQPAEDSAND